MKRIGLCVLLGVAIFCGFGTVRAEEPNLRFGFLTDTHVLETDASYGRVRQALTLFREKGVSLIAHGGDVGNMHVVACYEKYKGIFDEIFADVTPPVQLTAVGNHDTSFNTDAQAAAETLEKLGVANTHTDKKVVGGYVFLIMPYTIGETGFLTWSDYETAVATACAENPGKPVFLLEHEPPQDTIYNSHNWGSANKRAILDRYPQVVELSGHVHGSLRNDQFIWQGAFTVINAGCLQTWNGLLKGESTPAGKDSYAVLTIDVFDDRLVAHRWDILDGSEIDPENPWTIPLPFAAATAPYNRETLVANEVPAAFPAAAEVSVSSDESNVTVSFPEISGNVMTYLITVKDGSATLAEREIFSDFWREPSARTGTASLTFPLSGFAYNVDYTFEVRPVGQYGAKGAAISRTWHSAVVADPPDRFIEYIESDGSTYVDTEVIGRSGTKAEIDILFPSKGGAAELGNDCAILDVRKDGTNTRFFLFHTSQGTCAYGYGTYYGTSQVAGFKNNPLEAGVRYRMASTLEAGNQAFDLNGTRLVTNTDATSYDTGKNLYLFANNYEAKPANGLKARCYSLKIWQTDGMGQYRLVRDFRPCIKGNVAGLFDQVSGRIFYGRKISSSVSARNLAAPTLFGTLTAKGQPDCFVEYIESDGRQILDTGLPARAGVRAWADMQWHYGKSSSTEHSLLAAQPKDNKSSVYLIHDSYKDTGNPADGGKVHHVRFICGTGFFPVRDDGKSYAYEFHTDPADNPRITVDADFTDPDNSTYSLNEERIWAGAVDNVDSGLALTMFGSNFDENTCQYLSAVRIYGLKLWLDGELVRNFRPCVKNGEAGLYDAVNDEVLIPSVPFPTSGIGATVDEDGDTLQFVDYVENDGAQASYVDTEIIGRSGTKIEADILYPELVNSALIGSRVSTAGGDQTRIFPFYCSGGKAALGYADFYYTTKELAANVKYRVETTFEPGNQTLDIDGERIYTGTSADGVNSEFSMYLFGANIGGTVSKAYYPTHARCYGLKIWQTDADGNYQLVRDFRPCVKFVKGGIDAAGLYDTVSKRVFNTYSYKKYSTHSLKPGNDTVRERPDRYVEYIQSTGLQMLDTGVPARTGVKAEGDFMFWLEIDSEQCYLGALGDQRMYMIHQANKKAWASFGNTGSGAANPGYLKWPDGTDAQYAPGVTNHFVCDWSDSAHATLDVNGKRIMDAAKSPAPSIAETLGLFACGDGAGGRYPSRARCYGLKLWLDGALVRDFRPCVKGGRGALYDKVTHRIYFPMGADITEANVGPSLPSPGFQIIVR